LRDAALPIRLEFRKTPPHPTPESFVERKAANAIRTRLLNLMDLDQLYDLDRVDLTVKSTLDRQTQRAVTRMLVRLKDRAFADSVGLFGARLLQRGDPSGVVYSFTLYESTPRGNLLRVQADNYDQPLDINEGAKLDLGSTAKLRTLVNYLDIVAELHSRFAGKAKEEIRKARVDRSDPIRRWAIDFLAGSQDTTLLAMLEAAMERRYSAGPSEKFFTGGGLHTFENFDREDNASVPSVREATRRSINLAYIRLMRDIARYYTAEIPGFSSDLFEDPNHPGRRMYLSRFADKEGRLFMARYFPKYKGKTPEECLDALVEAIRPTPKRLAVIFRSVRPQASREEFQAFLARHLKGAVPADRLAQSLYEAYPREAYDLADRGYIARVHPLDLWLAEYLYAYPGASWHEVVREAAQARQDVYKWLFKTRYKEAQNKRIRILLEEEAFERIHKAWKRQGYPFSSLVPSYATSIGSSADRPAALAELMGIMVNGGIRYPTARLESLHFAEETPFEILFERKPAQGERVFPPELAQVVRNTLIEVVEHGTARRAYQVFKRPDGSHVPVGGKTGTGDHRYETFGCGGHLIESRVVNRTATFMFLVGDRYFGTLSAYVHGPKAAQYGFTSSLPVQILKTLAPVLSPLVTSSESTEDQVSVEEEARSG
jgi:membrane peptidoglycan carboxypeptidase